MRIVVLGAGTVGTSIADVLCQHGHSVAVVDADPAHTKRLNDELDVRAITGSASQSSVLFQAGVLGADLCLAVTGDDEVNLVAASMAKAMGARRTIARVYSPVFRDLSTFDYQRHFRIDRLLSLEHLSAIELARGIRHSGSLLLETFARGEIEVQEIEIVRDGPAVGVPLKDLEIPKGLRLGSIFRAGTMKIAGAHDKLAVRDKITLFGPPDDIERVGERLLVQTPPKRSVVIAGGGETGYHLASVLEGRRFHVTLMEVDRGRCEHLAAHLHHTTVVNSDSRRRANLEEERVGRADVFVACTGDDENNIMACVEARELGTENVMSIVGRPDYANVVGKLGINLAVSPREVVAKQVLGFLNVGPVVSRTSLAADGSVDVFEIDVLDGAPATEHKLQNMNLPADSLLAAVIRESYVRVPTAEDRLNPGDIVIALVARNAVNEFVDVFTPDG